MYGRSDKGSNRLFGRVKASFGLLFYYTGFSAGERSVKASSCLFGRVIASFGLIILVLVKESGQSSGQTAFLGASKPLLALVSYYTGFSVGGRLVKGSNRSWFPSILDGLSCRRQSSKSNMTETKKKRSRGSPSLQNPTSCTCITSSPHHLIRASERFQHFTGFHEIKHTFNGGGRGDKK